MENNFTVQSKPTLTKRKDIKTLITVIAVIGIFLLGGGAGYLVYNQLVEKDVLGKANTPEFVSEIQQKQVDAILKDLNKLILITEEEEPTVATIVDVEVLRKDNPEFYKNAQDGDILIIYSKRAIVFRRDKNMIVNVAPVFVQPDSKQATPQESEK